MKAPAQRAKVLDAVTAKANEVLGIAQAKAWMRQPVRSLGGVTPDSLITTGAGRRKILHVLGRMEHGVYS